MTATRAPYAAANTDHHSQQLSVATTTGHKTYTPDKPSEEEADDEHRSNDDTHLTDHGAAFGHRGDRYTEEGRG